MGVAVACLCTWDWLADLGAHKGLPCVLGHALSRQASPGGKATNDKRDAHQRAVLLRWGMLPPASVSPADLRATRARLRRRMSLTRKRAELRAHIQHTHSPSTLPELGTKRADTAHRAGVAERCPALAVHKSMAEDLALLGSYEPLLRARAWPIVTAAPQHDAHTLSLLQTVPGMGNILRRVLLDASHAIQRGPSVQDVVSSGRLGKGAQASAGTRSGTAGDKSGQAYLTWACSAAGLVRRDQPAGQQSLPRLEQQQGQGQAVTLLAQQLGRAVLGRRYPPGFVTVPTGQSDGCPRRILCPFGSSVSASYAGLQSRWLNHVFAFASHRFLLSERSRGGS
jgi:hypothetical protein